MADMGKFYNDLIIINLYKVEEQFVDTLVLEVEAVPEVDTQAWYQTGTQSVPEAGTPSAPLADKGAEPSQQ